MITLKEKLLPIINENTRYMFHINIDTLFSSIYIMENTGKALSRMYWYHDDKTTIYLDTLSVDENIRQQGIGTNLQKIREDIGIILGADTSCLFVKKDTWMHQWYKRRGYIDFKPYDDDDTYLWMKKILKDG
jgi:ribosomal protein S18 acetylase RimI-like enzyme